MPEFTLPDQARLYYDDIGNGSPLLLLHGGLGRYVDWFHSQIETFSSHRLIIPDRRGYGRSTPLDHLPVDYHVRNADDMLMLLDSLSVADPILWGHSDGAIIAAWMAIKYPRRVQALILEGTHLWRRKTDSLETFEFGVSEPEGFLPERAIQRLQEGHGKNWNQVVANWGNVWLRLNEMDGNLYDGRLPEIQTPTLVMHGIHDPHSSVTEIKTLTAQIPDAQLYLFQEGGHSPHSERANRDECNQLVREFICQHNTR
ncbi:MAG: alpha/beta hydrolase [Anaerolineales bacterium]|nr:MAG: alpha/beta hydrolase [Anaerolineales bacterium]